MMRVKTIETLPDARLRVTLESGRVLDVDVSEYLDAPGYEALRDPAVFAQATPEEWGDGVVWPEDVGIPVSALYRLAQEQAGRAFPTAQFCAWMQRNNLSAAQAAKALGLTRRTIIYYHTGGKPVPLVVGLACEGYEARQHRAA